MEKMERLKELYIKYQNCQNCFLWKNRSNIVFGSGDFNVEILFIGEAPGHNEDIEKRPFCGAAGHLLDNYLNFINMDRKDIYITNIVKCRPPNNRNPYKEEIKMCKPILDEQLEILSPKIIITLGNIATQSYLNLSDGISSLRGQWFEKDNIKTIPMFHPAALLRDPQKKEVTKHDFLLLKREFMLLQNKKLLFNKQE